MVNSKHLHSDNESPITILGWTGVIFFGLQNRKGGFITFYAKNMHPEPRVDLFSMDLNLVSHLK